MLGRLRWSKRAKPAPTHRVDPLFGDAGVSPSYPPVDPGLPCLPVEEILNGGADILRRIKLAYGADEAAFESELAPLVRRYAEFVHLLPATADNYFKSPGGLFRLGVEVALFALQGTDSQIFSGASPIVTRRHLEPRWRKATFIAGLCVEVHRTLSHVIVTDAAGHEWPAYLQPLSVWLARVKAQRYYLKWVPNAREMKALGVFALPHIADAPTLQYLADGNSSVVPQMMGCMTGMPCQRQHSALDQIVRRAAALVIDRDLRGSAERYGKPILGSHLERYLLDGMRRLVASNPAWRPNAEKSRVWFGSDGLYVVWPNAAADLIRLLEDDQLPGIPKSPETIVEILIAAGLVVACTERSATWDIYPPATARPLTALRLSHPEILFGTLDIYPTALPRPLAQPEPTVSAVARPQPAATSNTASSPLEQSQQVPFDFEAPTPAPGADHDRPVGQEPDTGPIQRSEAPDRENVQGEHSDTLEFALNAPGALSPPVRQALDGIVRSVNGPPAQAKARTLPAGLFVPLTSFASHGVEPAIAVRALSDAGMIVRGPDDAKTSGEEFAGARVQGIVVAAGFITGLAGPC